MRMQDFARPPLATAAPTSLFPPLARGAAGLVLQVTEPHLNGLGGEVPVIAHHAGRGETFVLCGQGTAPAAATPEAFGDLGLDLVPGSGLLAACVPGAFGAWMLLLREYGTLQIG